MNATRALVQNIFVPHKKNNYRPHAIRRHGLLVSVALILLIQLSYNVQVAQSWQVLGYATNINSSDLLTYTNQNRTGSGLAALSINTKLTQAAQNKAQHMIANDYWAHIAPDGTSPWDFINNVGYLYLKAGENLAYGFATSSDTLVGWMNSPTHAANILNSEYEHVGFGIANGASFQGGENTVVVAMYGDPNAPAEPSPPAPVAEPVAETPAALGEGASEEKKAEPKKKVQPVAEEEPEPVLQVVGEDTFDPPAPAPQRVSNLQAILNGSASWALYSTTIIIGMLSLIYAYRHVLAVQQIVIRGEHTLHAHPLFEASLIYIALWMILSSQYGAII